MKSKKAFSLAEVVMTLSIIIAIVAMVSSGVKKTIANADQTKIKHSYAQVLKVIQAMSLDIRMYPNLSGFADVSAYRDPLTGAIYTGGSKFAELFQSKLNVLENIPRTQIPATSNVPRFCQDGTRNCTNYTGGNNGTTLCFTTTNKVTYCLPRNTTDVFPANNNSLEPIGVIKIFYDFENHNEDKDGYYVAVTAQGKVSVLNPSVICERGINRVRVNVPFERNCVDCSDAETYKTFNQCKFEDYITDLKL